MNPPSNPRTVAMHVRSCEQALRRARVGFGHGTHDALQEATWLVAHATGHAFEALSEHAGESIPVRVANRIERLLARRIAERIPMAYLLREAWLGELKFYVDERVITPRSFIAEPLRNRLSPWIARPRSVRRVLDLCTGSGCLAIAAARAFTQATVDAIDLSKGALAVARRNVALHDLEGRVTVLHSDGFDALARQRYDLILSNPPYVNAAAMRALPAEYRHEPGIALAGGRDGLDLVRRIVAQARRFLKPHGWLVLEIGHNRRALTRAFPQLPFIWLQTSAGNDSVCLIERESLLRLDDSRDRAVQTRVKAREGL